MKKVKKAIALIPVVGTIWCQFASADAVQFGPGRTGVQSTVTGSTPATSSPAVNSAAATVINGNVGAAAGTMTLNQIQIQANSGATNGATQSSSGNNLGGIIATAVGGGLFAVGTPMIFAGCGKPDPASAALCYKGIGLDALGGLALLQGISSLDASSQNSDVAQKTLVGQPLDTTPSNPNAAAKSAALAQLAAVKAALKQAGVTFDTTTGVTTLPNGKTFGPGDATNVAAMAADLGISQSDYKGLLAKAGELEKKALAEAQKSGTAYTASNGFDSGGGAGGFPNADGTADPAAAAAAALAAKRAPANDAGKAGVAGMARNYNGDMIGVAGDDIFQMMTRRYQEKVKNQSFLSPEALPTGTAQALPSLMPKSH